MFANNVNKIVSYAMISKVLTKEQYVSNVLQIIISTYKIIYVEFTVQMDILK